MTTINQDHAPQRAWDSQSPRLSPPRILQPQQASINDQWTQAWQGLQQQVHDNTASLELQRSHIYELHDAVKSMHSEFDSICRQMRVVTDVVQTRLGDMEPEKQYVDILTQHLQTVDKKASEITGLKVQLDIIVQRLRRLEVQQQTAESPVPHDSHYQQGPNDAYTTQQPGRTTSTEYRALPPAPLSQRPPPYQAQHRSECRRDEYAINTDARSVTSFRRLYSPFDVTAPSILASSQHAHTPHEPAAPAPHHDVAQSSVLSVVNAKHGKRPAVIDATAHDASATASQKRQKLARLMPRSSRDETALLHADLPQLHGLDARDFSSHFSSAPAVGPTTTSVPFPPTVEAAEAQQEACRAEYYAAEAARGRAQEARYRGRGRRAGSQGYPRNIDIRRDWPRSGGNHCQMDQANAMVGQDSQRGRDVRSACNISTDDASQCSTTTPGTPTAALQDSGNKSRTKPMRNANGILVRQDGRPDMRSISSAQNLRKVHAKKDVQREREMANRTNATSSNPDSESCMGGNVTKSSVTPIKEGLEKSEGGEMKSEGGGMKSEGGEMGHRKFAMNKGGGEEKDLIPV
ncbi:hypothetical protein KVT40_002375 [Elsinoe batatas]|uniref:Uncharacterized protein n=1 Tax=Elsinoe batatas TaxID=2601811 RepID=A0A8K0LAD6_9PEZI|nr:hypothetical protein KVT40_002375 [Elsinoe batatas]